MLLLVCVFVRNLSTNTCDIGVLSVPRCFSSAVRVAQYNDESNATHATQCHGSSSSEASSGSLFTHGPSLTLPKSDSQRAAVLRLFRFDSFPRTVLLSVVLKDCLAYIIFPRLHVEAKITSSKSHVPRVLDIELFVQGTKNNNPPPLMYIYITSRRIAR